MRHRTHRHCSKLSRCDSQGAAVVITCVFACATPGCVRRTITITSDPSGALVWLNDREIGRTPVDVDFTYYGEYDVRLVKDGYEPLVTSGKATPPVWDNVPLDLGAELWPSEIESRIAWHFALEPAASDPAALLERAASMRSEFPPVDPVAGASPQDSASEPAPEDQHGNGHEQPPEYP